MGSQSKILKIAIVTFAIVGLIALILGIGMWGMHQSMMGGEGIWGRMMSMCGMG